ncbi:hypothetical protein LTR74_015002 [Friedmanniomyces endolithicus]|nr:hypothetical protein LTR74_015002 [Friedmanniomyces endolithicus]
MKLTLAPLDVGALTRTRTEELINFVRTLETGNVVVPSADASKTVDSALQDSGAPSPVLRVQLDSEASQHDDWANLPSLARDGAQHDIDQQALLNSARSYDPSGCPRRVGGMTQFYDIQTWGPEIGPTSNFLFSTANFRIVAPSIAAAVWEVGGTVVKPGPAFAPETVLDAIEKHEITHFLLLLAQVHSVVAHPTFKNRHVDTVRSILTGSDVARLAAAARR